MVVGTISVGSGMFLLVVVYGCSGRSSSAADVWKSPRIATAGLAAPVFDRAGVVRRCLLFPFDVGSAHVVCRMDSSCVTSQLVRRLQNKRTTAQLVVDQRTSNTYSWTPGRTKCCDFESIRDSATPLHWDVVADYELDKVS